MKVSEARAIQRRAERLIDERRFDDARALVCGPSGAPLHTRLRNVTARIFVLEGRTDEAENELLKAVMEDPTNSFAVPYFLAFNKHLPQTERALSSYVDLAARTGHSVVWARACALQIGRGEMAAAADTARIALSAAPDVSLRSKLAQSLAGLFFWSGRLDLADALILESDAFDQPLGAALALARLRKGTVYDEATHALLTMLSNVAGPCQDEGRRALFDYRWVTEGPTVALLRDSLSWTGQSVDVKLRAEQIALATELGLADEAASLLKRTPDCAHLYAEVPAIARMLSASPPSASAEIDMGDVDALADLSRRLAVNTAALAAAFADRAHTLAIVGNSACAIGRGEGASIDACDSVIRFNRGHSHGALAADFGSRTDVHVLPIRGDNEGDPSPDARFVLFTTPYAHARNRDWSTVRRLSARGFAVASIPGESYARLSVELKAPPSNGLRVCAHVADVRGGLDHVRPFGFSFVDQIAAEPASSHYFERSTPSRHHNWLGERAVFDRLFRRDG